MTIQSTERKAGPFFTGTILPFTFKVFSKEDIQIIWTSAAGVESTLVLDSEYSVALNPDQDNTPGGSVTLNTAISGGANAVIIGDLEYDQGTDIRNQSGFEPEIVEDALDRVTILVQQLLEMAKRTLRIPASSSSTISTQLPQPTASNVLGWNGEANQLVNLSPQDIATTVAFGTAFVDQFEGDGVETEFSLSANPALLANMDVQVGGVSLRNGIDFILLAGAVIKFTTPPAAPGVPGSPNIQIRGTVAVPQGFDTADVVVTQLPESGLWTTVQGFINRIISGIGASIVGYLPAGTGAVATTVERKLREWVSVKDFGAAGDGVADDTLAIQAAFTAAGINGVVFFPQGFYKISAPIIAICSFYGTGSGTEIQPTGNFEAFVINIAQADNRSLGFVRDFIVSFENAVGASTGAVGMWLSKNGTSSATSGNYNVKFSGIYLINCYRGIQQKFTDRGNLWNCRFENILVLAPREHGIYLDLTADNGSLNVSFENVTIDFGSNPSTAKGAYINGVSNLTYFGTSTSKLGTDASCFHCLNSTNVDVRLQIESVTCTTPNARLVFFQNCSSVELSLQAPTCVFDVGVGNRAHYIYIDENCERFTLRSFDAPSESIISGTIYVLNVAELTSSLPRLTILDPQLIKTKVYANSEVFSRVLWPEDTKTGTFFPILVPESGSFSSISYNSLNGGRYIRVGNLIHFQMLLYTNSITIGTAALELRVGGLPFISLGSTGLSQDGFCSASVGQSSLWNVNHPSSAVVRASSNEISLYYRSTANGADAAISVGDLITGSPGNIIRVAGTYVAG